MNVLIVEDDPLIAREVVMRLECLRHSVCGVVDSVEDAHAYVAVIRPDLVLVDIELHGERSGIELAGLLRRVHRLPVVFMTSHADGPTLERAVASEPFGYIVKPVNQAALAATIETALARHGIEYRLEGARQAHLNTLNTLGDMILTVDANSRITFCNSAVERGTGQKREDTVRRSLHEVLRASDGSTELLLPWVERAVAAPLDKDLRAALLVGAQWREVDCSMRSLRDDSGRVLGAVFVIRHCALPDIDDERRSFEVAVP